MPFPPIPTPIARHQHNAAIFTPTVSSEAIIGIIAAVNGILSIAADITAATHIKAIQVIIKFSCITSPVTGSIKKGTIYCPRYSRNLLPSTPPTNIKRATKNISSGIS